MATIKDKLLALVGDTSIDEMSAIKTLTVTSALSQCAWSRRTGCHCQRPLIPASGKVHEGLPLSYYYVERQCLCFLHLQVAKQCRPPRSGQDYCAHA